MNDSLAPSSQAWLQWLAKACEADYDHYIQQCKSLLAQQIQAYQLSDPKTRITWNLPENLPPTHTVSQFANQAVLLIHGFTASPYIMRSFAYGLQAQGISTRTVLLPGHGTSPEDLLHVTGENWLAVVRFATQSLLNEGKKVHLLGFSLGGTLASLLSQEFPLASLGLIAPAHAITPTAKILPALHHLSRFPRFQPLQWLITDFAQKSLVNYHCCPINGAYQVLRMVTQLSKQVRQRHHATFKLPVFSVMTGQDLTVNPQASLAAFLQNENPNSRAIWYDTKPKKFSDKRLTYVCSHKLHPQVLALSHPALPVKIDDPYYGILGLLNADATPHTHYTETLRPKNGTKRLSFNPHFATLLAHYSDFLANAS